MDSAVEDTSVPISYRFNSVKNNVKCDNRSTYKCQFLHIQPDMT